MMRRRSEQTGPAGEVARMADAGVWRKITPEGLFRCGETDDWEKDPSAPYIVRIGDRLRMYYHGRLDGRIRIGFAEASVDDPLTWTKHEGNPVLDLAEPGEPDSVWCAYPWVVPITETRGHMYYAGFGGEFWREGQKTWYTMLAVSDDAGITWRRSGLGPLIEVGEKGSLHEAASGSCAVIRVGEEYRMYYTALRDGPGYPRGLYISIALATSPDGWTFTPHEAGALLKPDLGNPLEDFCCSKPAIYDKGDHYELWYNTAGGKYRLRYAESRDGMHFDIDPNVVVDASESGWDSVMTEYPCIVELSDRDLLYYCGDTFAGIGVAERSK